MDFQWVISVTVVLTSCVVGIFHQYYIWKRGKLLKLRLEEFIMEVEHGKCNPHLIPLSPTLLTGILVPQQKACYKLQDL